MAIYFTLQDLSIPNHTTRSLILLFFICLGLHIIVMESRHACLAYLLSCVLSAHQKTMRRGKEKEILSAASSLT